MEPNLTNRNYYARNIKMSLAPYLSTDYEDVFSLEYVLGNINDPKKPDYRDPLFTLMLRNAELPYTLMDGTKGLRAAKEKFTPRMREELLDTYENRLMRTVLHNKFASTIQKHSDRIFSTPVKIANESEADNLVFDVFNDVTKTGTDCSSFLKNLYKDAKVSGVSFIFIDSPQKYENETIETQFNNRSFFIHLTIKDILGIKTQKVNGVEKIVEFRYIFYEKEYTDFGFKQVKKVRQIEPFKETFYKETTDKEGASVWITEQVVFTEIEDVQLYPYFTNKLSFTYAKPPLENLAYLNLQHWNHYSDHSNILHFTQCPILALTGSRAPDSVPVASATVFFLEEGGTLKYVEATCASIKEGAEELRNLERQMEELSNEALMKPVKYETATSVGARQENLVSQLESEATQLQALIDKTFKKLLELSGYNNLIVRTETGDSWYVEVNRDLGGISAFSEVKAQYLDMARSRGDVDLETYIRRMQEFGIFPQNESIDKIKERIEKEKLEEENKLLNQLKTFLSNQDKLKTLILDGNQLKSVTYKDDPKPITNKANESSITNNDDNDDRKDSQQTE